MPRIWFDVIKSASWRRLIDNRERWARAVPTTVKGFRKDKKIEKTVAAGDALLLSLEGDLRNYHAIPKNRAQSLGARITRLDQIASKCDEYLDTIMGTRGVADLHTGDNKRKATTIDTWVRWLAKRARYKAAYIGKLDDWLKNAKPKHRVAAQLINLITNTPRYVSDYRIGLVPGVWMEKIDFMHRNYEFEIVRPAGGGPQVSDLAKLSNLTFSEWMTNVLAGHTDLPYFLWLEAHPWISGQDAPATAAYQGLRQQRGEAQSELYAEAGKSVVSIQYGRGATEIRMVNPLTLPGSGLRQISLLGSSTGDLAGVPFDTYDYGHSKLEHGAAYVWSKDDWLYVGPHGTLHHSSLQAGRRVQCAGMIRARNGKVEHINVNSGHYKPKLNHLYRLVCALDNSNAFAPNAEVGVYTQRPHEIAQDNPVTVAEFRAAGGGMPPSLAPFALPHIQYTLT